MTTETLAARDDRKSRAAAEGGAGRPGCIRVESFDLAREVLRHGGLRQAGFGADLVERFGNRAHAPVLYQSGEAHQKQRSATARFFAPKVVTTRYRDLMETLSDALVGRLTAAGRGSLDQMSLELAVAVAAEIIGLTDSDRSGMAHRLGRFFASNAVPTGRVAMIANVIAGQWRLLAFYLADVRPAIRARRRVRRDDLVSHLIDQTYSDREILTECLTYAAAGMATTREFIVMAAWHLLENDALRQRFLDGDEAGRIGVLEEILRLEPVVGALYRSSEVDMSVEANGRSIDIPAGRVVEIDIRAVNTDAAIAGRCPHRLDVDRELAGAKVNASLMSFGDGPHRCPGATVALQETAIFLDRLLRLPNIRLAEAPTVSWNALIASYELRGAVVRCEA